MARGCRASVTQLLHIEAFATALIRYTSPLNAYETPENDDWVRSASSCFGINLENRLCLRSLPQESATPATAPPQTPAQAWGNVAVYLNERDVATQGVVITEFRAGCVIVVSF